MALRLPAVEIASTVPTQITRIMMATAAAISPMLTRRRVRRASQRCAKAPNTIVVATTRMTGAGIRVDAVVSASTRDDVSW